MTDKYFHKSCFQCIKCNKSLAIGGFFSKDNNYYCVADYQKTFGTKCAVCQQYVEGEVVSTMGNTYHQKCFTCTKCMQPFESGSKVISTTHNTKICGRHSIIYLINIFLNIDDLSKGYQHRERDPLRKVCRRWKSSQAKNDNATTR